ncbi:hypothetical protein PENTCL1PPCAC_4507 [Pristionchus entomophagus]|uniref:Uncharacterized protein n=1 Tax=Pristionchus entomophagus TaxID=358040 RepID=A0AAV5SG47_9BILA|nr:hypothetical protein PENTCL1PPCAC_4507 [Pristionchus entomophagus]
MLQLRDTALSLPEDVDLKEYSTVCFSDFVKFARGRATPRQIAHLPHCGWDVVAALKLQQGQRENDGATPPKVPVLR